MDKTFDRRTIIKAGAAMAVGAAAAAALPGCSEAATDLDTSYLPLGSVVKIKGETTGMKRMIIARRPLASAMRTQDGVVQDNVPQFDYATVCWPLGILSDLSARDFYDYEVLYHMKSDISEVCFEGYKDDQERRAASSLAADMGTSRTGVEALEDQALDIYGGRG